MMLMPIRRLLISPLALCIFGSVMCCGMPSLGAEPRASLSGPTDAAVGEDFFLRFRGTISDSPVVFKQAKGPAPAEVMFLSAPGGQVACAVVNASRPGPYSFALLARGKANPTSEELIDFALLTVQVGAPEPPDPGPGPNPNPNPNPTQGAALGRTYGPLLLSTYADAVEAAAAKIAGGSMMAEAAKELQTVWATRRTTAFNGSVGPEFAKVLTPGTEPADASQRAAVSKLFRDYASGIREVK